MKIEHTGSEVVSTSQHREHKFGVNQGAQMFKVLSSTLYSDKVRAIIRELACNAWDAHVAAGKSDTPFDLHLPTIHEPWFSIKDYGTGLSDDDLFELFCTYFGSNKTTSNKFIGALGLGSKSPFCYTQMFNIKCTFEGVTRMYEARVDEHGEPTVQQMGQDCPTPQLPNGIEIKFAVKQNDIWEFENKAKIALEFFQPRPTLNTNAEIVTQTYTIRQLNWGLRSVPNTAQGSGVRAIMGNVGYGVGQIDVSRLNSATTKVASMPLDIFFNIGELSFTASREALELDEKTVKNLTDAYVEIYDSFIDAIRAKINVCANAWDARILVFNLTSAPGMGGIVNDAWNSGKLFGHYDSFSLEGKQPSVNELDYNVVNVLRFNHNRKASVNAKKYFVFQITDAIGSKRVIQERIASGDSTINRKAFDRTIEVEPNVHFIINDLEKKGERYVHYFVQVAATQENHGKKIVYMLTRMGHTSIDALMVEAKKLLGEIGTPKFELASELQARYRDKVEAQRERQHTSRAASGRRAIVELRHDFTRNRRCEDGWKKAWKKSETQPAGTKYYITLERLRGIETGFDTAFKFLSFVNTVRRAGTFGLDETTPVYGLRKNAKLRKNPEWVELTSHVMESVKGIMTPVKELQLALLLCPFDAPSDYDDVLRQIASGVTPLAADSPFQRFAEALAAALSYRGLTNDSFKEVLDEASRRGYYKQGPITDFNNKWHQVLRHYPLIAMVGNYNWSSRRDEANWRKAVLDYINMIDNARKQEANQTALAAVAGDASEVIQ